MHIIYERLIVKVFIMKNGLAKHKWITFPVAFIVVTLLSASTLSADQVNVYSARKEALIKPVLDIFTEKTGIKVNLITGKADALLTRLKLEGSASPADVFITVDAGRLHRAKEAGVLQTTKSPTLEKVIPQNLRDVDGHWFGLSQRARPIFYAKARVNPDELSTYEALGDEKWKGRICMRSSNNIYNQSLVASMMDAIGEDATQAWVKQLVGNFAKPPTGGDIDQLKAVKAGVCDVAIANTYYFGRLANSQRKSERSVVEKLAIYWPNQDDRGTHVNVSGAGITTHAKNAQNGLKLIEFLASAESQEWYSAVNNEYPVVKGVVVSETLKAWGEFKQDTVDLVTLGVNNRSAVELMDRAGWR